ncbi:MAG TPA: molybdopterin-dependent oxidoreductase [Terriglobales bacterium]|nr:molybdopterin-dependent oxidoreductase [Terriglobales bacterium]
MEISRRTFLQSALAAGAVSALGPLDALAAGGVPGKERLIVNSLRYFDLEAPASALTTFITPVPLFFVRNHVSEPFAFDLDAWRLNIVGEVERPVSLTMRDLVRMEAASVTNTLECAGNGRAFFGPHVPGIQWKRGAVGTARFTGPRLKDVLARAGLKSTAKHVAFKGLEEPPGRVPQFIRSIPIEKALDSGTLVALHMNGAPLLKHHGFPARALVPGWIGAASVKWLTEVRVLDREFEGNFMKPGYRLPASPLAPGGEVNPDQTAAITRLNVKSLITHPAEGARIPAQAARIAGMAWAGEAEVVRVEISTDGGASWSNARLGAERARYAWRMWEFAWKPPRAGEYTILSRATDSDGRTQPAAGAWNPSGYLWNGYDRVRVNVTA